MEMKIKIHSFIDVITNSSTTIFVTMNGNAIKEMYDIINEILSVAKSDKKAEDLFSIEIDRDWDVIFESYFEDVGDDASSEECAMTKTYNELSHKEWLKYAEDYAIPYMKEHNLWQEHTKNYDGYEQDSWLIIKSKTDDNAKDIWKMIRNLFSLDGYYNG